MQDVYNWKESYQWNYDQGPQFTFTPEIEARVKAAALEEKQKFLGYAVNSTIGVAAGPLLNSKWITTFARLGFDIPTYKTVRKRAEQGHAMPNVLFLNPDHALGSQDLMQGITATTTRPSSVEELSITNSFGMPCQAPEIWREDGRKAKEGLEEGQLLAMSVVASPKEGDTLEDVARDYAWSAREVAQSGADVVEFNLSCPNVTGKEGVLFQNPTSAGAVAEAVKEAAGKKPVVAKLGYYSDAALRAQVVERLSAHVQGLSAINTLPMKVYDEKGKQAMPGKGRLVSGICGAAIRKAGIETVKGLHALREKEGYGYEIIGVGGVMKAQDALDYYDAGADCVQSATAVMWDPLLAVKIKEALKARRR